MSIGEADLDNGVQGERSSATLLIIQNSEVQVQRDKAGVACLRYRRTLVGLTGLDTQAEERSYYRVCPKS